MKSLGNVVLAVATATTALLAVGSWVVGPSLALLGPFHYMTLVPALAGFVLLVVQWKTRGAHRFVPTGLALAAVTVLMGLVVGATGLKMMFGLLASDAVASDAVRFRQLMANGMVEALGLFYRYVAMAALQVLLWMTVPSEEAKAAQRVAGG